jgi:hypothetical protein
VGVTFLIYYIIAKHVTNYARAFPSAYSLFLYFTSSKPTFFTLPIIFYNIPHILLFISQYIQLKYYKIILFFSFFFFPQFQPHPHWQPPNHRDTNQPQSQPHPRRQPPNHHDTNQPHPRRQPPNHRDTNQPHPHWQLKTTTKPIATQINHTHASNHQTTVTQINHTHSGNHKTTATQINHTHSSNSKQPPNTRQHKINHTHIESLHPRWLAPQTQSQHPHRKPPHRITHPCRLPPKPNHNTHTRNPYTESTYPRRLPPKPHHKPSLSWEDESVPLIHKSVTLRENKNRGEREFPIFYRKERGGEQKKERWWLCRCGGGDYGHGEG